MLELVESNIPGNQLKIVKKKDTCHVLVTGDSLKIMQCLQDESVDLIVTDPPYNVGLNYGPFYNDRRNREEFFNDCYFWLEQCARILNKTGSFYLISYPEINARLLPFVEDKLELKLRRWITWHYPTNIGHSKRNFTRSQRSILFLTKSKNYVFHRQKIIQHYKNPEVSKIKDRIKMGSRGRTSYDLLRYLDLIELNKGMADVLDINLLKNVSKDRFNKKHPCQLPLGLLRTLVAVSSNKGDILLDPFAGTFTLSAVAAILGRNSIGIELNPDYVQLGLERLRK